MLHCYQEHFTKHKTHQVNNRMICIAWFCTGRESYLANHAPSPGQASTRHTVVAVGSAPSGWLSPSVGRMGLGGMTVWVRIMSPSFILSVAVGVIKNISIDTEKYLKPTYLPAQLVPVPSQRDHRLPHGVVANLDDPLLQHAAVPGPVGGNSVIIFVTFQIFSGDCASPVPVNPAAFLL